MQSIRLVKFPVWLAAACAWLAIACAQLSAQTPVPTTLQVPLFPEFDLFGNQFEVVQAYENDLGEQSITAGIYDTGASVVTFSPLDQNFFFEFQGQPQIPIIPGAVAEAQAIGGTLQGDVSVAGRILAAGASALDIDFDTFEFSYDLSNAVSVDGVQAFVGTTEGSPNLPSIVGVPINVPSATNPAGLATVLDQTGFTINLGALDPTFGDIPFELPDVRFVQPGTNLVPTADTYEAVTIPVSLLGIDNTSNPGNDITAAPNPFQPNTAVSYTPSGGSPTSAPANPTITVDNLNYLFDTGAQLSIISTATAAELGLTDIDGNPIVTPFDFIDVQGAGNAISGLPGYVLDKLTLPRTDGGLLEFTDVPVYVLDIGEGIDGILGMNLFNGADSFIYDPYHEDGAQFSALFFEDRSLELVEDEAAIFDDLEDPESIANLVLDLLGSRYALANPVFPGLYQVPEPSTYLLAICGLSAFAAYAWRRRRGKRG